MDDRGERSATSVGANQRPTTAPGPKRPPAADRRLQRLADLTEEGLAESDPLRATLRVAAADLFEIAYRQGAGINAALAAESNNMEACQKALPVINGLALVHRQAARYVQSVLDRAVGEDSGRGAPQRPQGSPIEAGETAM
jgi:hypothetical protein